MENECKKCILQFYFDHLNLVPITNIPHLSALCNSGGVWNQDTITRDGGAAHLLGGLGLGLGDAHTHLDTDISQCVCKDAQGRAILSATVLCTAKRFTFSI